MSDLPDAELLRAHVDGDPDAFAELFARHRDRLWAVALRTMGNPEDAADGLQDGLIAAYRRAGSFRGEAAVTTWMHRIVVNACLDRHRRRKVRRTERLPEDPEDSRQPRTGTPVPDPADVAVDLDRRAAVLAALETLPVDQRAALVLVDMEGYSVEETAAILGCAPGTVKSRCSRGRARLVPLLAAHRRSPLPGNPATGPRVGSSGEESGPHAEEVTRDDA
jgi:RNA polymerase sigma-70 factor, ECF subfamily